MQICFLDPLTVLDLKLLVKGLIHGGKRESGKLQRLSLYAGEGHSPNKLCVLDRGGGMCFEQRLGDLP